MFTLEITCPHTAATLARFAFNEFHTPSHGILEPTSFESSNFTMMRKLGVHGCFDFEWKEQRFSVRRTHVGAPQGGRFDLSLYTETILTGPTPKAVGDLLDAASEWDRAGDGVDFDNFRIYVWNVNNESWITRGVVKARAWDSVVLEENISAALKKDVVEFASDETRDWYHRMGVPYRRGYLLYGPPGTGKTSTIGAVATLLKRHVHKINLVAPKLTDDSLQLAVNEVSNNAIIVLEDVDCLFSHHREKTEHFNVTFSGLLNAIDGLQDTTKGKIFIFTTNHRERIDAALRRKGRIDLELALEACTREQTGRMFKRFYPEASDDDVSCFVERAHSTVHGAPTPAVLQEYFVRGRHLTPSEAAKNVSFDPQPTDTIDRSSGMWS